MLVAWFILLRVFKRVMPALNLPLAITVISWAFNFVALKILYTEVSPPAVALMRFALMYAVLLSMCRIQGLPIKFERRDAFSIILLGFVSMGIYMILFLEGMHIASANEGAIILATSPILTGLMAVAFKQERFSWGALAGAVIGFAGVVLVVMEGAKAAQNRVTGDLMIFGGAILWAYSAVLMKTMLGRYHPVQLLTLAMPGALIALLPYGLLPLIHTHWNHIGVVSWLLIFHLAAISGAFGFAGFYAGVRKVGAGAAMLYQYFIPPLTVLFAWWLLGSPIAVNQLIGLAIVFVGVAISMHFRASARAKAEIEAV